MPEIETSQNDKAKTRKNVKKKKKKKVNVQELWDNYKRCNIYIIRMSGEERKGKQKKYMK